MLSSSWALVHASVDAWLSTSEDADIPEIDASIIKAWMFSLEEADTPETYLKHSSCPSEAASLP